jgi:hypothetical protein
MGHMTKTKKWYPKARKKDLTELWSLRVKERDGFICQWCPSTQTLNSHHIIAKGVGGLACRYELENGMTLCFHCHQHRLPTDPDAYIAFRDSWLKQRGLDYHEMRARYNECKGLKFNQDFFDQKWAGLKGELI